MQDPTQSKSAAPAKAGEGKEASAPAKPSVVDNSKTGLGASPPLIGKPQETAGKPTAPFKIEPAPPAPQSQPVAPLPGNLPGAAGVPIKQEEPFRIGTILEPALWLVGALLLLAVILAWIKRYQQKDALENRDSVHDQLAKFRQALEDGEMSETEFRQVKARLTEKLRHPAAMETKKPADLAQGKATEAGGE
jgi:hypothetical protein